MTRLIRTFIVLVLPALVMTVALALPAAAQDVPRMPKEELKANLGRPDIVLIDVRAVTDWFLTKKKIKTAVRQEPGRPEAWMNSLPKDKTIVLYCA